jgi:hypothetical protein
MRYLFFVAALCSVAATAAPIPDNFSQANFEKRFRSADKDKNGMLSREEAYAEFPRMPEFFDEIDTNRDNKITLLEVKKALKRRVDAAMSTNSIGTKYVKPTELDSAQNVDAGAEPNRQFSSKAEAQRYQRYQYYDSLAAGQERARSLGVPVPLKASPNLLNKSF